LIDRLLGKQELSSRSEEDAEASLKKIEIFHLANSIFIFDFRAGPLFPGRVPYEEYWAGIVFNGAKIGFM